MVSVRQQLRIAGLGVSHTGPKNCRTCDLSEAKDCRTCGQSDSSQEPQDLESAIQQKPRAIECAEITGKSRTRGHVAFVSQRNCILQAIDLVSRPSNHIGRQPINVACAQGIVATEHRIN